MKIGKNMSVVMCVGLAVVLFGGCGGVGDSKETPQQQNQDVAASGDDTTTDEGNNTVVSSYIAGNGVLVETRANKTLVWVNTTEDAKCKISRATSRFGTVYQDGVAHCQSLNHGGRSNRRLPTIQEAQNLMKTAGKSLLIFPSSNPNCAIMTTATEETFVYTTSDWNIRDGNPVGGAFVNAERNNKTAGIRCVATQ